MKPFILFSLLLALLPLPNQAELTNAPAWLLQPLTLSDCVTLALQRNSTILKGQADLEAAYGVVVQTRSIVLPRLTAGGDYQKTQPSGVETFPSVPSNLISPFPQIIGDQKWSSDIRLVQSVYDGGRMSSALRTARLTKEQALLQYQTVVADTLLAVRVAYDDALLAEQQITVQEASVRLLEQELEDQRRRFEAGTVPRFNVLRAEVEVANARPRLIRARNAYRIGKNDLANLLGYNLPREVWEDIPLRLTDRLQARPYQVELPAAVGQALANRPELASLRKAVALSREDLVRAQAGWKPTLSVYTGYGARNSIFSDDLGRTVAGWYAGAQVNWDIFDGFYTQGKIKQAKALEHKAQLDLEDNTRRIELDVRTAYSNFIEAREVLESQSKVLEEAEESLRLATVRSQAGTSTQLDVLSAQTALTEARTTQIQSLHDYAVAQARLERAIGENILQENTRRAAPPADNGTNNVPVPKP